MKTRLITWEIKETVMNTYRSLGTIRATHRELSETLNLTFNNIRDIVNELKDWIDKQRNEVSDLTKNFKDQEPYEVDWDDYIIYIKETNDYWESVAVPHKIKISTVDAIFKAYSKHWENKSGQQIIQEFGIENIRLWHVLKSRLELYKDSHILSPASLERFEWREEEMKEFIDKAVDDNIRAKYIEKFKDAYDRKFKANAIKAMKRLAEIDDFLDHLRKYIDEYEPRIVEFKEREKYDNWTIDIAITDLHIWKKDTDLVLKRLESIYQDIAKRDEWTVNIFCLWDLAEILVEGWRHPWQIEWMDWPFWFDLFMKVVNDLENFLVNIYKLWKKVKFVGISWNHWTLSDKKGWDIQFTWELLIYELIKRGLQNTNIEIEYLRGMWHSYPTENFHYILNHWYAWHTSKKAQDILWEFWDNSRHNIILQWDKHHTNVTDVSQNATRIITPCLAWKWEYDTQLWISSYPGYVMIKKNEDGLPDTTIRRLK